MLALIMFGSGALNNSTAHSYNAQQIVIPITTSIKAKDESSDSSTSTSSSHRTKISKITKPAFKDTARGKLRLQRQRRLERFTRIFLEEPKDASQGLLDYLMDEPLIQEAEKRSAEKEEEMKKRDAEKREKTRQRQKEYLDALPPEQREARKERIRDYMRKYYAAHKEKFLKYRTEYQAKAKKQAAASQPTNTSNSGQEKRLIS